MTPNQFEIAAGSILREIPAMTLATCNQGIPWATDVYFAAVGFELFFFSSHRSRHCRNLAVNPCCAATVHPTVNSWKEIKGLQMEGVAEPVSSLGDKAQGLAAYLDKFPFARELFANPTETISAINKATMYVMSPSHILLLDNALGFGSRYGIRIIEGCADGPPERVKSD